MDFATGTAGMAPSLEEVLRFLDFHGEPGGIASSPTSALTPGLDSTLHSPTFFAGLDGQPKVAQGLGATELASQLRQLALLTQAQSQLSPMKQLGGGVEQFAAQLQCQTAANLGQRGLEAGELLALQAALQAAPTRRGGNSKSRTGPINNPLYKTELCRSWEEFGSCRYGVRCQFAHGHDDLNPIQRHPKYKTEVCRTFATNGTCPYGTRCRFIHQSSTLAQLRTAAAVTPRSSASAPDLFAQALGSSPRPLSVPASPAPPMANTPLSLDAAALFLNSAPGSSGNLSSLGLDLGVSAASTPVATALGLPATSSPFAHVAAAPGPVTAPVLQHDGFSPVAPPLRLSVATNFTSAPATPRGTTAAVGGAGANGGSAATADPAVRRIGSDNNLAPSGTPTSARRLPIFSSLAEEEEAK